MFTPGIMVASHLTVDEHSSSTGGLSNNHLGRLPHRLGELGGYGEGQQLMH
jgi:hypothetical protein